MTGADYKAYLENKYDKPYSAYFSDTQLNRIIKEAMYRAIDSIYAVNDTRKEADELYALEVKNESAFPSSTGRLNVDDLANQYYHLLRMAFVFKTPITFTYAAGAYTSVNHTLRAGDVLTMTGATDTAQNTTYTVTKVKGDKFYIPLVYVDGDLDLYSTQEASPKQSDMKKSFFHAGTANSPKYEASYDDGYVIPKSFYLEPAPYSVLVDYVLEPPVQIDVTNTSVDLESTYSFKFLMRVADEVVRITGEQTKDPSTVQMATQAIINNP